MGIREFLSARHMSLSVCLANPSISTYFLAANPLSVIVSLPSYPTHKCTRVYLSLHLSVCVIVSLLSYPTDKCVRVCASTHELASVIFCLPSCPTHKCVRVCASTNESMPPIRSCVFVRVSQGFPSVIVCHVSVICLSLSVGSAVPLAAARGF